MSFDYVTFYKCRMTSVQRFRDTEEAMNLSVVAGYAVVHLKPVAFEIVAPVDAASAGHRPIRDDGDVRGIRRQVLRRARNEACQQAQARDEPKRPARHCLRAATSRFSTSAPIHQKCCRWQAAPESIGRHSNLVSARVPRRQPR